MLEDLNADMIHSQEAWGFRPSSPCRCGSRPCGRRRRQSTWRRAGLGAADRAKYTAAGQRRNELSRPRGTSSSGPVQAETLKRRVSAAAIAVRRKDTYRIKEELSLNGGKPNIGQLLWREMKLRDVSVKPLDGSLHLDGELTESS